MIFDESRVCRAVFCREVREGDGTVQLPQASLTVVLVSSGRAAAAANSAPFLLGAGELLLARGAADVTPATNCHVLAAGFDGFAAQEMAEHLSEPLQTDGRVCPMAAQLLSELAAEAETAPRTQLCFALLCALACADAAAPRLPKLVADAIVAIRQNYAGLYGVEELSAQLGVSKNHLVRVFSAELGMPPGQYLTRVRVDAVKQLLAHRDYPLAVVATLCGFSGANYLCKVFKKETGQTPAAWRAQNAGAGARPAADEAEGALFL